MRAVVRGFRTWFRALWDHRILRFRSASACSLPIHRPILSYAQFHFLLHCAAWYCNTSRVRILKPLIMDITDPASINVEAWGRKADTDLAAVCLPCASTHAIGRVSYIRIYLCYFCFRWKTVSLVHGSLQYLMHHVTVSLQQSKITLQNNCINNTSITQPTLSFYF